MEKAYLIDILFDLMNESDTLEAELQDLSVERDGLTVIWKDGTAFTICVKEREAKLLQILPSSKQKTVL